MEIWRQNCKNQNDLEDVEVKLAEAEDKINELKTANLHLNETFLIIRRENEKLVFYKVII